MLQIFKSLFKPQMWGGVARFLILIVARFSNILNKATRFRKIQNQFTYKSSYFLANFGHFGLILHSFYTQIPNIYAN